MSSPQAAAAAPHVRAAAGHSYSALSNRPARAQLVAPFKHQAPSLRRTQPFYASLPLSRSGRALALPRASSCPYRSTSAAPAASGSGDAEFDQRWMRLPGALRRFVWEISSHGRALERDALHRVPISTYSNALTAYFAIWTGGKVSYVPPHWQPKCWNISPDDEKILTRFLQKMADTADFRHPLGQQNLLTRLDSALQGMQAEPMLFESIMHLMDLPINSCFDTITLTFNDIDLAVRMHEIMASSDGLDAVTTKLWHLGTGLIRLNTVRKHAWEYWQRKSYFDQIEITLKFEVLLARELDLPVVAQRLRYGRHFHIDDSALTEAANAAQRAMNNRHAVDAFFAQWDPWQQQQRKLAARFFTFDRLPTKVWLGDIINLSAMQCAICLNRYDDIEEPVFIGRGKHMRLYARADLIAWWCISGRDPLTREPFELTDMYRLLDGRRDNLDAAMEP